MEQEITEQEIKELRMRKQIAELEKQENDAWSRFYNSDTYKTHPDYIEYRQLQRQRWKLQAELKEIEQK